MTTDVLASVLQIREPLPLTIRTMLEQMRWRSMRGAVVYVGGHDLRFRHPAAGHDEETRGTVNEWKSGAGVEFDVGVTFRVNGKPGERWTITVVYTASDNYSVWLWAQNGEGGPSLIERVDGVYCEELAHTVESVYDRAIETRNGGFIPLD